MKNKYNYLLLFAFTLANFAAIRTRAQNLVQNPSFEQHTRCFFRLSTFDTDFVSVVAPPWQSSTSGTSDYFNACSATYDCQDRHAVRVPNNQFGNALAAPSPEGQSGYTGLFSKQYYREYITGVLTNTLKPGGFYHLSFQARMADASNLATKIGMCLSVNNPSNTAIMGRLPQAYMPLLESPSLVNNKTGWSRYDGFYTVNGYEKFVTLGCFASTWKKPDDYDTILNWNYCKTTLDAFSYHYIDNVGVEDCCDKMDVVPKPVPGDDPSKCCYDLYFDGVKPCSDQPTAAHTEFFSKPFLNPEAPIGGAAYPADSMQFPSPQVINGGPTYQIGQKLYSNTFCFEPLPRDRITRTWFYNDEKLLCYKEKPISCKCFCDKMQTFALAADNGNAPECCWNIMFNNLVGGCPTKSAKIYTVAETGERAELATVNFPQTILPGDPAAHTVYKYCRDGAQGSTIYVRYFTAGGDTLCDIPVVLPCCGSKCGKLVPTFTKVNTESPINCCWKISLENKLGSDIKVSGLAILENGQQLYFKDLGNQLLNPNDPVKDMGEFCFNDLATQRTITVQYFGPSCGSDKLLLCYATQTLECCGYDSTKLVSEFTNIPDSLPKCCWKIKTTNNAGSNIKLARVVILENGVQLRSKDLGNNLLNPDGSSTEFDLCFDGGSSQRTITVEYQGLVCGKDFIVGRETLALDCPCCKDVEVLSVPSSTNPCCNDVYITSAPCDIYTIKVDVPNNATIFNPGSSPLAFPKKIGTFCNNSTSSNTVTLRLRNQDKDTICTKQVLIGCKPQPACCKDLFAYLTPDNGNTDAGCVCKYNVIVAQAPGSECKVYSVKIHDLAHNFIDPGVQGNGPLTFGSGKNMGKICVMRGPGTGAQTVTVNVYIEFLDENGNVLCSQMLTQTCSYYNDYIPPSGQRLAAPSSVQTEEPQLNQVINFICMPNPFNNETIFGYTLQKTSPVKLELYDSQGKLIDVIENTVKDPGTYKTKYINKRQLTGLYMVKLTTGNTFKTIRVIIE